MSSATCQILGYLVADPELMSSPRNQDIAKFRLLVVRPHQEPDFFDCDLWGDAASTFVRVARKGSEVLACGFLHTERWSDSRTGALRQKVKVRVSSWSVCGKPAPVSPSS